MTGTGSMTDFTGNLGTAPPDDVAISADGSLIYAAGTGTDPSSPVLVNDGDLRIYNAATGALVETIHVGTRLGGIDLSPDGSFLMVTELAPAAGLATVYKVGLASGSVQAYSYHDVRVEAAFYDVAVLSDGTALLTLGINGSGSAAMEILDPVSGTFSNSGASVGAGGVQNSALSVSPDGTEVLIGYANQSDAPLYMYAPGRGLTAYHGLYADGVMNFNQGIQALDPVSGTVAQFVHNNGLHIYDETLHYQLNVSALYPSAPTVPPAPRRRHPNSRPTSTHWRSTAQGNTSSFSKILERRSSSSQR